MNITEYTLNAVKEFISGDNGYTPRLGGKELVALFNSVGFRDLYQNGMPDTMSRNTYVLDRLKKCDPKQLKLIFELVFSKRHFLQKIDSNIVEAVEKFNEVIAPDGIKLIEGDGNYLISGIDNYDDERKSEVYFEELRNKLVSELNQAKFTIWVAVAWFTDKGLYQILVDKTKMGLSVGVILIDDEINKNSGLPFGNDFFAVKVKKTGVFENLMHHKFCVIDLKTVIHGSYNWTNKAQYNKETLDIEVNRENAEKFAEEFINLKRKSKEY